MCCWPTFSEAAEDACGPESVSEVQTILGQSEVDWVMEVSVTFTR